ncbi:MAG: ATP-binding cassette domain-containing protein, partial [Bdellovibrionales bacterium]|nr:ATP-binding cassette domain-containing protein [Bdellovibrionales bacterium]
MNDGLLVVKNLEKRFPIKGGILSREVASVRAVQGVSFTIQRGETLGLVGESGCGKSTLGRCILRLIEPTSGEIYFDGRDVLKMGGEELRLLRRKMQIIFQDPFSSLNPRLRVGDILGAPFEIHGVAAGSEKTDRVARLLRLVGLMPEAMRRYPHEFSGGQRQRIGIARALALDPKLIIGDEPVSALDVSIQAQIINLLKRIQAELGLTYILISHNLSVVSHVSDVVAVMYLGQVVETAPRDALYFDAKHPYTEALLSAVPLPEPGRRRKRILLKGDVPSPVRPPGGCRFHPRCA